MKLQTIFDTCGGLLHTRQLNLRAGQAAAGGANKSRWLGYVGAFALANTLAFSSHAALIKVTPSLSTQTPVNVYLKKDNQPLQIQGVAMGTDINSCLDLRLLPSNSHLSQLLACKQDDGRTTTFQFRSVVNQAADIAGISSTNNPPTTAPAKFTWFFPPVGATYNVTLHLSEEQLIGGSHCHLKIYSQDGEQDNFAWLADNNSNNNPAFPFTVSPTLGRNVTVEMYSDVAGVGSCTGNIRAHADIAMIPHSISGTMSRSGLISITTDGHNVTTINSGPKGAYSFPNLLPGTYTLYAREHAPGQYCATRNITVTEFDLVNVNLSLVYCPNPDS